MVPDVPSAPPASPDALPAEPASKDARIAKLRGLIAEMENAPRVERVLRAHDMRDDDAARSALPGRTRETPRGLLHAVEHVLEPHHCHGRVPLRGALEVARKTLAGLALDASLEDIDPRGMLFLDTETTGLSGGAGTLPFVVGLAWFEDESLVVEQLLLRRPGEEVPMLERLAEKLREATMLVTFNGKTFDWPLLRTRFVLNRVPTPIPRVHLDLLHCARRFYKPRLGSVRLVTLEEELLGKRREGDVDGALIPSLYLHYLRTGDASGVAQVVEHNAHDVVAMAALVAHFGERYEAPHPEGDSRDHLAMARVAARAEDEERALAFAHAAIDAGQDRDVVLAAHELSALIAKRAQRFADAVHSLEVALSLAGATHRRAGELHGQLTKLYEHRIRHFERALFHAERAMEADETRARRIARLEKKLARAAVKSAAHAMPLLRAADPPA